MYKSTNQPEPGSIGPVTETSRNKYSSNRSFEFAITELRFKSGLRFQLSNRRNSKYEFQFSFLSQSVTKIAMTVAAILTFSHIVVQLFGQTIPDLFWPVFKDIGAGFIIFAAFAFAVAWFLKARPHNRPKHYSVVVFDIDGKETVLPGLRTEFRNHDVAWSFMKQYKESYPLNNFALVSDVKKDRKKVMFRYI